MFYVSVRLGVVCFYVSGALGDILWVVCVCYVSAAFGDVLGVVMYVLLLREFALGGRETRTP